VNNSICRFFKWIVIVARKPYKETLEFKGLHHKKKRANTQGAIRKRFVEAREYTKKSVNDQAFQ